MSIFEYYPYSFASIAAIERILCDGQLIDACKRAEEDYERNPGKPNWAEDVKAEPAAVRRATLEQAHRALAAVVSRSAVVLGRAGVADPNNDEAVQRTYVLAAGLRQAGFHVLLLAPQAAPCRPIWIAIVPGDTGKYHLPPGQLGNLDNEGNLAMVVIDAGKKNGDAYVDTPIRADRYYYIDLNEAALPEFSDDISRNHLGARSDSSPQQQPVGRLRSTILTVLQERSFEIWDPTPRPDAEDEDKGTRVGTGFFISCDGLALTAFHVVKSRASLQIRKEDLRKRFPPGLNIKPVEAKVLFHDEEEDIAILGAQLRSGESAPLAPLPLCRDPRILDRDMTNEIVAAYGYIDEPGVYEGEKPYLGRIAYRARVRFEGAQGRQVVNVIVGTPSDLPLGSDYMKGSSGGPIVSTTTGCLMGSITGRRAEEPRNHGHAGYAIPIDRIIAVIEDKGWKAPLIPLVFPVHCEGA